MALSLFCISLQSEHQGGVSTLIGVLINPYPPIQNGGGVLRATPIAGADPHLRIEDPDVLAKTLHRLPNADRSWLLPVPLLLYEAEAGLGPGVC